jgi:hypothetical protein
VEPEHREQVAPGPRFPDPEVDRAVYDYAAIFSPETIVRTEATIDADRGADGGGVVVYTQPVDYGVEHERETAVTCPSSDRQWGIGRKGFDDGMVVFFDIDPSGEHGQVQLYARPGFETRT